MYLQLTPISCVGKPALDLGTNQLIADHAYGLVFERAQSQRRTGAGISLETQGDSESWRPTLASLLVPKSTALKRDLRAYLPYFNHKRAPTGRNTTAVRHGAGLGCAEGALSCISATC